MQLKLKQFTFTIDPGQNTHYWTHINSVDWEPHTFTIFDRFINENSTVLDIGAWSGLMTLYAARIAKSVHAIDPDPVCFKELNKNIELNPEITSKVKTYQTAISDKKELVELSARNTYGASSSSILQRHRDMEKSYKTETISLNDFIEKHAIKTIDFIKMDVEGAEFKILPTIENALKKLNYPTLYVSFHYEFLNENIYYQNIKNGLLTKLLIKVENIFGFKFFKTQLHKKISNLFKDLEAYKYIYKTDGDKISFEDLSKKPELIAHTDLVFTNKEW